MRKYLIHLITPNKVLYGYSTFKGACVDNKLPYNYLKKMNFPINYKGYRIERSESLDCPIGQKWEGINIKTDESKDVK
jgi:hypothetical protein